jgi:alpha-1,3-rhamnosyl/mannosyltransferase
VKAFGAAQSSLPEPGAWLILVGDYEGDRFHADVASLRRAIETTGVSERVRLPGFVPDPELRHLYGGARALVLPSLEEGFGLPAVEAAACGTPCIATQNSPLPELLADGGIFVEPTDTEALQDALIALARDRELRARLGARALERARALTWRATADATRAALEAVARGPR